MLKPAIDLADILEKDWQKTVRDLGTTFGYRRAYHTFDSRRSDTGFPDLVLVSPERHRIIYLELKRENGKVTAKQAEWIRDLHQAGAEVYVARPRHLQTLATVLAGHGVQHAEARDYLLAEIRPLLEAA